MGIELKVRPDSPYVFDEKHKSLLMFLRKLADKRFTGQLRINFHCGFISNKIITLISDDLGMSVMTYLETSPPPLAKGGR